MEARTHYGGLRAKSKVPRPRCSLPQRPACSEFSNGSLRLFSKECCEDMNFASLQQDTDEYKEWQRQIGQRVCVSGVKRGILRYFGRTVFAPGDWCGIELDEPVGKNDGTVNGVIYFSCRPGYGIFAPVGKVSKLDVLNNGGWVYQLDATQSKQEDHHCNRTNWDYAQLHHASDEKADFSAKKFVKNSPSDPTFFRPARKTTIPHCSESFPCDKRAIVEQRGAVPFKVQDSRNFDTSNPILRHKTENVAHGFGTNSSFSSYSLNKYEHAGRSQYFSNAVGNNSTNASVRETMLGESSVFQNSSQSSAHIFHASQSSDLISNLSKTSDTYLNSLQSHELFDFDDDNDYTSEDYDESIGILTPSQMRELTFATADLSVTLSNPRNIEFPSSESFDDINELPEDEQVHNPSMLCLEAASSAPKKAVKTQSNADRHNFTVAEYNHTVKNNFSFNTLKKDTNNTSSRSSFEEDKNELMFQKIGENSQSSKINNVFDTSVDNSRNDCFNKSLNAQQNSNNKNNIKSNEVEQSHNLEVHMIPDPPCIEHKSSVGLVESKLNVKKNNDATERKEIYTENNISTQAESENISYLAEIENGSLVKEKLTVSWEDCLSCNEDNSLSHGRPESVYTVASCDTGFHEDCELDGEAVMVTSLDSTDSSKRFSTVSKDSCLPSDEIDVYKIVESNSTSGYSTALSDSCCNDRAEDDTSSKPLTDEEIPDSVDPCDSEDGFSFQENSFSKDIDMLTSGTPDVTTENATVLFNDSTSDALCETMVEDATLTEIHSLLLSPEEMADGDKPTEETGATDESLKETSKENSLQENTSPESKPNTSGSHSETPKSTNSSLNTTKFFKSDKCSEDVDKKKQVIVKSPKKNVMSKIKAMIEATSCRTVNVNPKAEDNDPASKKTSTVPKKSRWDAVTSKIAQSLAEEKTKPKIKKEIKSRVNTNLTTVRNQPVAGKPSKLESSRLSNCEGSMSPLSVSSRDRKANPDKNRATNSRVITVKEGKQRPNSQRPDASITSRSASPVAPSESSTASYSLNSHHSRTKVAVWKGSSSTIASSIPPPVPAVSRQQTSKTKPPSTLHQPTRAAAAKVVNKRTAHAPKIRITPPPLPHRKLARNEQKPNKIVPKEQSVVRPTKAPVRPPMWLSKAELTQEIQRLSNLCEARTKELNRLKMETKHVTVGFDAFAALFKYMVEDINGLSVPVLSGDLKKTLKQLELTKQDLAFYEREVEELKAQHCLELDDLSNRLYEVFQGEFKDLNGKHEENMKQLLFEHQKQVDELSVTFNSQSTENTIKHETIISELQKELIKQREELQIFQEREIADLEEKHIQSTKILQEHIEQLQKKCAEFKQHSQGMEEAMRKDTNTKLQWVTSVKSDLDKEVESLKTVLELRNNELRTIRVQNLEMEKQLEELPLAREKIKMLQARAEDLEALMVEKTNSERKLLSENQDIRDTYEKEAKVNRRISMEKDELLWRLKQAEHTISSSFSEFPEYEEEIENGTVSPQRSPTKSPTPHTVSRSTFFTFVDKSDVTSSPRTQYKKISSNFSSNYKTSPAKSSVLSFSPSRNKSHSEPPQPALNSTPKKTSKFVNRQQKRSGSDCCRQTQGDVTFISLTGSMTGSECFEQKEITDTLESLDNSSKVCSVETLENSVGDHAKEVLQKEVVKTLERTEKQEDFEKPPDIIGSAEVPGNTEAGERKMSHSQNQMVRSSDPKSYYHMTFPVDKEAAARVAENTGVVNNSEIKATHSKSKDGTPEKEGIENIDSSTVEVAPNEEIQAKAQSEVSTEAYRRE